MTRPDVHERCGMHGVLLAVPVSLVLWGLLGWAWWWLR